VGQDVRDFMQARQIAGPWKTGHRCSWPSARVRTPSRWCAGRAVWRWPRLFVDRRLRRNLATPERGPAGPAYAPSLAGARTRRGGATTADEDVVRGPAAHRPHPECNANSWSVNPSLPGHGARGAARGSCSGSYAKAAASTCTLCAPGKARRRGAHNVLAAPDGGRVAAVPAGAGRGGRRDAPQSRAGRTGRSV